MASLAAVAAVAGARVRDLVPYTNNLNIQFIVVEKDPIVRRTNRGMRIHQFTVADETGSVILTLWEAKGDAVKAGDILRLTNGVTSLFNDQLVVYNGRHGKLEIIGEFTKLFSEVPNMSKLDWVHIEGTEPKEYRPTRIPPADDPVVKLPQAAGTKRRRPR